VVDVPTYNVDKEIGYVVKPGQSGSFLRKNRWVFNDRSMGTEENRAPTKHANILVIGNSIVMGGNPYDQKDKVGPLIQQGMGSDYSVWPIAAGGWTNLNESVYLERNSDVTAAANFFVWEYMSDGLSGLRPWPGDYVCPREQPTWATWYVFRRYVVPRLTSVPTSELPPVGDAGPDNLKHFEAEVTRLSKATLSNVTKRASPGILFLYPTQEEYGAMKRGEEWLPERSELERICRANGLKLIDVARNPDWNETLYRDGLHPTATGNAVLARILTRAIQDRLHP
jgi:hypothetical protein